MQLNNIYGGISMSKIYCDEIKREVKGFENVTLYHGFGAFFNSRPIIDCFKDLMNNPQWQVCTSTKYLGMIGVCIEGDILIASSYDLFSGIDRDNENRRFFDSADIDNLVYDYTDLELHEDDPEENNEVVLTNTKITGIWVTSDASNKMKAFAKDLSDKYNLPLIPVGESIFC
jgi:hypothetical protein